MKRWSPSAIFTRLFVRRYEPGTVLSIWWGAVYHDHARRQMVCVPIPFNIPARMLYVLWLWSHRPWIGIADEQAFREHGAWWTQQRCKHCGRFHDCQRLAHNFKPPTVQIPD